MPNADDTELMCRFQENGDGAAFETLFQRHRNALLGYLVRLSGDAVIAEDVSQHAWCKLIEVAEARGFEPERNRSFRSYLFALARNRYIDEYCRRHGQTRTETLEEADLELEAVEHDDVAHVLEEEQTAVLLREALTHLPFDQRDVISLWATGMDIESLATLVGAPRETVLSRKKYAIAKLRKALSDRRVERYDL